MEIAAYYVAFGPHGPREPILAPGGGTKIVGGIVASVLAAGALFYTVRLFGKSSHSLSPLTSSHLPPYSLWNPLDHVR